MAGAGVAGPQQVPLRLWAAPGNPSRGRQLEQEPKGVQSVLRATDLRPQPPRSSSGSSAALQRANRILTHGSSSSFVPQRRLAWLPSQESVDHNLHSNEGTPPVPTSANVTSTDFSCRIGADVSPQGGRGAGPSPGRLAVRRLSWGTGAKAEDSGIQYEAHSGGGDCGGGAAPLLEDMRYHDQMNQQETIRTLTRDMSRLNAQHLHGQAQLRQRDCEMRALKQRVRALEAELGLVKSEKEVAQAELAACKHADEGLCVICLSEAASHVAVPCGHLVLCGTCRPAEAACPVCRQPTYSVLRVYRA